MSIQIVEIAQPSVIDTVAVAQPSTVDVVEVRQGPAGPAGSAGPNVVNASTTSDGTADLSLAAATVSGTLTASHIHGNLAGSVYAHVRAGEALLKGDPVYVSGFHNGTSTAIVSKADASNAAKMPAIGIMDANLAHNATGHMVITGTITDVNTAGYAINAELYVAAGGGMTATPPTARAQPVARVERSNANNGAIIVKVNELSASDPTASTLARRDSAGGCQFTDLSASVSFDAGTFSVDSLTGSTFEAGSSVTFNATAYTYGTGAASAHRIALGAGTTGATLFGAADAGAARTTLGLATADSPTFAGITASGTVIFGAGAAILNSPLAGVFTITNAAGTGFGRLCFGPATPSFAAFRSTGTTIDVVTGNESGFANMQMNNLTISGQLVVSNTPLTSNTNVAGTTGAQNAFTLSTTTNGAAAATFGPRLRFQAESASGTTRDAAAIDAAWTDATDATRTADIVFNTVSSASALTERMRLSSQGNLTASGTLTLGAGGTIIYSASGLRSAPTLAFNSTSAYVRATAYGFADSGFHAGIGDVGFGGNTKIVAASTYGIGWGSASSIASGSIDTALYRASAGVVEINNGTLGQLRDGSLRNLTASGTVTATGIATASNFKRGAGSPESAVTGIVGDIYTRTDGGAGTTLYVKESGTGNTGWAAK